MKKETLSLKKIKAKYKEAKRWANKNTPEKKGTTNCYLCEDCQHVEKYQYIDSGVTPFIVRCTQCNGLSHSQSNKEFKPHLNPTKEWFRPSLNHVMVMQTTYPAIFEHVLQGGLMPRDIQTDKEPLIIT